MNILVTGGTGFVGKPLVEALLSRGDTVTVLTRSIEKAQAVFSEKTPQFLTALLTLKDLNTFDAVINLAGEPIFDKKWTVQQKEKLRHSRINLTQQIVQLINQSEHLPVLISGSATGIYGDRGEYVITEDTHPSSQFTAQLCIDWENAAKQANTRVCLVRTGLVLSPNGGAFAKILPLYRFGLGGKLGNGEQYWSWIALEDMVEGLLFLLDHNNCEGAFNFTAPHPIKNKTFNQLLGKALHRPCFAQVPQFLLTTILGERACILLDSQNAYPKHLLDCGFTFQYSELSNYLHNTL